jgi:hypothetical protein
MQIVDIRTISGELSSGISGKECLVARREPPAQDDLRRRRHGLLPCLRVTASILDWIGNAGIGLFGPGHTTLFCSNQEGRICHG